MATMEYDFPTITTQYELLTTPEAAEFLNVPQGTLRWWRHQNIGPKGFRLGARKVMYRRSDLIDWLERRYAAEPDPVG
jgi:predicted DNA-binding transcriptional regulator AlpA